MINISSSLNEDIIRWFSEGFYQRFKFRLIRSPQPIPLVYQIEKRFYKSLLLNKELCIEYISMNPMEMERFYHSKIYNKHRLFFLMCLPDNVRKMQSFISDLIKEMRFLPREMRCRSIDAISNEIRERALKLFDYEYFSYIPTNRKYDPNTWNAYAFLNKIKPKVCPYCNINLTTIIIDDIDPVTNQAVLRPALDHYICKSKYPFFSVNIRNLIPSCTACNSNLKSDHDFIEVEHLNPYKDSISNSHNFILQLNKDGDFEVFLDKIYGIDTNLLESSFKITLIKKPNRLAESICRANNHIKTFKTIEHYNSTKNQYVRFIKQLPKTNKALIESYIDMVGDITTEEAVEELLQFSLDINKLKDESFSLLKLDLYNHYLRDELE